MKRIICVLAIATAIFTGSCTKLETDFSNLPVSNSKIVKFLSVSLSVPEDEIKFDSKDNQFLVDNRDLKISLEDGRKNYLQANEYKANFEKN